VVSATATSDLGSTSEIGNCQAETLASATVDLFADGFEGSH